MPSPPIRISPRWSRSSPTIEVELAGSRPLAIAWAAWCVALAAAIACGCELPPWVGRGLVVAVLLSLWRGVGQLQSPGGRLHWEGDGRWRHEPAVMTCTYVQPRPLRRLGSVLWLAWPAADGHRYASLDASSVEPKDWRAIKARMKFPGHFGHGAR